MSTDIIIAALIGAVGGVIVTLIVLFIFAPRKCELWKRCPNYRKDGHTCNDDSEARDHCGIRKGQ